jgi:hypothetical protein
MHHAGRVFETPAFGQCHAPPFFTLPVAFFRVRRDLEGVKSISYDSMLMSKKFIQVSLAIRGGGGYVSEKSEPANTKTGILGPD